MFFCVMVIKKDDIFFNPERDLKPVEPFGFVDLKNAFANGVIESQIGDSEENYNGIDDPTVILGRPRDIFDAMQARMSLIDGSSSASGSSENVKTE